MNFQTIFKKAAYVLSVVVLYASINHTALANQRDEVILYLNDPLGSAVAAFDENGGICWEETHTPYGDKIQMEDSFNRQGCGVVSEERGFTGHSEDFETDLVYMQQRYYDPTIGRFLSIDPVGPISGDPRTINRYSYAGNSPYKYIDPDGRVLTSIHMLNRNMPPEQALQASAVGNAGGVALIGSVAVGAAVAVPGPEDVMLGAAGAARGLGAIKKRFEVPKSAGQLGREGEATASAITGVGKNTQKFSVNGRNRIPDQVNAVNPSTGNPVHVTEVKNVASQSFTRQLRDNVDLVGPGGRVDVFVRPNTKLSGPLKRANVDPTSPINIRPEL